MILSDQDIKKAIKSGDILIEPYEEKRVGPCSVDLTLSDQFAVFKTGMLFNTKNPREVMERGLEIIKTNGQPFYLAPGQFILGSTREKIALSPRLAATLEGRSSMARLGVVVQAAGLVNPGTGLKKPTTLTLEIFGQANSTVALYPGTPIIQIIFHELKAPAQQAYDSRPNSKYVGLEGPTL